MTAAQIRTFLLAVGLLIAAFGLIYTVTPRGFSWSLTITGLLLATPWLVVEGAARWMPVPVRETAPVPRWHPESDA